MLDAVRQQVAVILPPAYKPGFANAFTHIFSGGYAAGYYSYKWAGAAGRRLQRLRGERDSTPRPERVF